jgi:hypothetical protein
VQLKLKTHFSPKKALTPSLRSVVLRDSLTLARRRGFKMYFLRGGEPRGVYNTSGTVPLTDQPTKHVRTYRAHPKTLVKYFVFTCYSTSGYAWRNLFASDLRIQRVKCVKHKAFFAFQVQKSLVLEAKSGGSKNRGNGVAMRRERWGD